MSTGVRERITLVFFGNTGVGKSTLANCFLGIAPDGEDGYGFPTAARADEVKCVNGDFLGLPGKMMRVVNVPGHDAFDGRSQELRKVVTEALQSEGSVHVFVWVKSAESPKFEPNDADFFDLFSQLVGKDVFLKRVMVIFTRFSQTAAAIKARKEKEIDLQTLTSQLLESTETVVGEAAALIPTFAMDALYNQDDQDETRFFREACFDFCCKVKRFDEYSTPVIGAREDVRALRERLERQIRDEQARRERLEEERKNKLKIIREQQIEAEKLEQDAKAKAKKERKRQLRKKCSIM